MALRKVAEGTPLSSYVKDGKLALKGEHRDRVSTSRGSSLIDSVNLEEALSRLVPDVPQWDYALGWISKECESCCFVEVHPANTRQVDQVVRKKASAETRLRELAPTVMELADRTRRRLGKPIWHWIATDAHVGIHPGTPASRKLSQAGIAMPARHLELR